ncbi:hypothetical protein ISS40_07930 [Candidatus Bathyarchaeota archaeon]|nr:hypothetical protein [Candidatus Bathyarchaeota archaeon]
MNGLIELCTFKIDTKNTTIPEKMKWGRIMVNAIKTSSQLLRDTDLDDLKKRLEALEEAAQA